MTRQASLTTGRDPRLRYVTRVGHLLQVMLRPQAPPGPIIVKSVWGLANRLYGLLNAAAYAARYRRPLHVDWTDGMYAEAGTNAFPTVFSLRGIESLDAMPRVECPFPDLCQGRLGMPYERITVGLACTTAALIIRRLRHLSRSRNSLGEAVGGTSTGRPIGRIVAIRSGDCCQAIMWKRRCQSMVSWAMAGPFIYRLQRGSTNGIWSAPARICRR